MEEREQIIFKTQMRGFEKKAVLEYIDQMTDTQRRQEKEFQDKLEKAETESAASAAESEYLRMENDRLTEENEILRRQAVQLEEKASAAEASAQAADRLAARERDNELLKSRVTALNEEILRLKSQLSQKEEAIRRLTAESDVLISQQSELSEKGMKYDQISNSVGVVVLEAQRTADAIIANANREAEETRRSADEAVALLGGHLNRFREEIERMRASVAHSVEGFESCIAGLEEAAASAGKQLTGESGEQTEQDNASDFAQDNAADCAQENAQDCVQQ